MTLSDDDMRRIDEEEYRKLARERLERTVRVEADIRTSGDQRLEVRGLGTEIYHDAKGAARSVKTFSSTLFGVVFLGLLGGGGLLILFKLLQWAIGFK